MSIAFRTFFLLAALFPLTLAITSVGSLDASIIYTPTTSWGVYIAPGGFDSIDNVHVAKFVNSSAAAPPAQVNWTTPVTTTTFEWWGYQRSDGGNSTVSIDGGPQTIVDYYNATATGSDIPLLLYRTSSLSSSNHFVHIVNRPDSRSQRTNHIGQMNVDHFVVDGLSTLSSSVVPSPSFSSPSPSLSSSSSSPSSPSSSSTPVQSSPSMTSSGSSASSTLSRSTGTPIVTTSSSNHAGAIAGGVVGGVLGLALIACAIFLLLRRRGFGVGTNPGQLMNERATGPGSSSFTTGSPGIPSSMGTVYNPNDPSTFPTPVAHQGLINSSFPSQAIAAGGRPIPEL